MDVRVCRQVLLGTRLLIVGATRRAQCLRSASRRWARRANSGGSPVSAAERGVVCACVCVCVCVCECVCVCVCHVSSEYVPMRVCGRFEA